MLWKIQRHSGVDIDHTWRERRYPLLALGAEAWRLYGPGPFGEERKAIRFGQTLDRGVVSLATASVVLGARCGNATMESEARGGN